MTPRQRRLQADYEKILAEIPENDFILVQPVGTVSPPERYMVTFNVPGLRWDDQQHCAVLSNEHTADIYLQSGYPREKPKCILKTPIWHPNFGREICIGDFWAAGETLIDVIVQIADMIQYKVYNTKSPLNAEAARWAEKNKSMFPVGRIDILASSAGKGDIRPARSVEPSKDDELEIVFGPAVTEDIKIDLI